MKESEINAYMASITSEDGVVMEDHLTKVTPWEHQEYFEVY